MNESEEDERFKEAIVRLIDEAPDPPPFSADRSRADPSAGSRYSEPAGARHRTRRGRPVITGWVAASAAMLAVAGIVLWSRGPEDTIVGSTAEQPPIAQAGEPALFQTQGLSWSTAIHSNEVFAERGETDIHSVIAGGPGLVAVGSGDLARLPESPLGAETATVWTSVDGVTWSQVPYDAEIFNAAGGAQMSDVTVGGPGLVAVGTTAEGDSRIASSAIVWTSVDGLDWSRVPPDEGTFGGGWMTSVTVGGPGLVAVGSLGQSEQSPAAVWTSLDGLDWTRVPDNEEVFGPIAQMNGVVNSGRGLVAVGATSGVLYGGSGVVWTSADCLEWVRAGDDGSVFGAASLSDVAVVGPGLVAVGTTVGDPDLRQYNTAAIWTASVG